MTATLVAAAGLAAAAFVYLRRRGIDPKKPVSVAKKGAKSAKNILTGESKAAYQEVRAAIVAELAKDKEEPSKKRVLSAVKAVMDTLHTRGAMTKNEFAALLKQLNTEWQTIQREASRKQS